MEGDYTLIYTGQIGMLFTEDSKNICHLQRRKARIMLENQVKTKL